MDMKTVVGVDYLVIWQGDGPIFTSKVGLLSSVDLLEMTEWGWVSLAAKSEGFEEEELEHIRRTFVLVCVLCGDYEFIV